ncbi:MAG: D-amino acid dehydrogenase, partial [Burkholderiales bacterium]
MKVCVLGAGVIGLTTAYFLERAGCEVVVVDRNAGVAQETSYANGGQLSYSYVAPLAGPGVLGKLPPWLMRRDSPIRFAPRLDYRQWRWALQFMLACSAAQSEVTTERLLRLSLYSRALMHELVDREHLDFNYARSGKLVFYTDARAFSAAALMMEYQRKLGCEQVALDAKGCVDLEPALEYVAERIVGGIYTPSEDAGDCLAFCRSLERILRARGVRFQLGTTVRELACGGVKVAAVRTDRGEIEADCYVIAMGSQSALLLRRVGINVPLWPLTGYSLTLPISDEARAPRVSVTDHEKKVVYARLAGELRVAGMADIDGFERVVDHRRIDLLIRRVRETFPGCSDFSDVKPWSGLRPATPRGTPLLGNTRYRNLLMNIGQGALGFTLACGCGKIVADLVCT